MRTIPETRVLRQLREVRREDMNEQIVDAALKLKSAMLELPAYGVSASQFCYLPPNEVMEISVEALNSRTPVAIVPSLGLGTQLQRLVSLSRDLAYLACTHLGLDVEVLDAKPDPALPIAVRVLIATE